MRELSLWDCTDLHRVFGYVFVLEDGQVKQMMDKDQERNYEILSTVLN